MSDLLKNGWCYLDGILNDVEVEHAKNAILHSKCTVDNNDRNIGELGTQDPVFDPLRGKVIKGYCPEKCVFLVKKFQPILEKMVGESIVPTYWFSTIYLNKSYMVAHTDRESCEISVSLNISGDKPWALKFIDLNGEKREVITPKGSGIAYFGQHLPHWRSPLRTTEDDRYIQFFLHYVKKYGNYSNFAYDQTPHIYDILK